jgi:hypothetical protein
MRCVNCDYILWNQPAPALGDQRSCPECGTGYSIHQYDFAAGRVQFCCEHCGQDYYGTSARGHIVPSEFACVRCGGLVVMDRCTLRPAAGVSDGEAMQHAELPWFEAKPIVKRWWGTTIVGITKGVQLPAMLGGRVEPMQASIFVVIQAAVAGVMSLLMGMMPVAMVATVGGGTVQSISGQLIAQALMFVLTPFLLLGSIAFAAALVAAAGSRDGLGFRRAYTLIGFSSGALIFGLIPCCGALIGYILWAIQGSYALATAMPRGKGAGVVVLAIVGMFVGLVVQGALGFAIAFVLSAL